jgi:hypothetical protein
MGYMAKLMNPMSFPARSNAIWNITIVDMVFSNSTPECPNANSRDQHPNLDSTGSQPTTWWQVDYMKLFSSEQGRGFFTRIDNYCECEFSFLLCNTSAVSGLSQCLIHYYGISTFGPLHLAAYASS